MRWVFRLYVAGAAARSLTAVSNLQALCEQSIPGRYRIEIVDLLEQPALARSDDIVAVPTVVRRLPLPVARAVGDLSDQARVRTGFGLPPG